MKKYAIIVDPFSSGAHYAEALRKLNIIPVAVLSHTPILNIYKDSFRESDFQHIYTHHKNDAALISALTNFLQDNKPLLVLPGTECGIELADKLADHFCPELSNGSEFSLYKRNKFLMAQQLQKNNIAGPLTIKSSLVEDVLHWADKKNLLPSGVVIKPLNSAGTDSVFACFSAAEIEHAMQSSVGKMNLFNCRNEEILAQEFVSGTEYVVDTVSYAGQHVVSNICSYKKIAANNSDFVYDYLDFHPEHGDIQTELAEYTYKVLDALNIKYGPAHSEIILTSRGPRLIETGARLHGGVAIPAARLATSSSHLDLALDLILNKAKSFQNHIGFKLKQHTRIVFLISYFENQVLSENKNIDKIKKLPSLVTLKVNAKPGSCLKKTIDLFSIPGLLILSHPSVEQVEADYQTIRNLEKEGLFNLKAG